MLEQQINLWDVKDGIICITTNGTVKKNGDAVMGRGCAKEAAIKHPFILRSLGNHIKSSGNHVALHSSIIITFPVKHNWWERADIELIKRSCKELVDLMQENSINKVYLPRPGTGSGKLNWEKDVKPFIKNLLPDSVIVIFK